MKQWISKWLSDAAIVSKWVVLLMIPTSLLLFHVWNQYRITELGYEIAEVTSEHQDLLEENKKLTVEARLQGRSDRVSKLAEHQFGLREASPEQFVEIDVDQTPDRTEEHAQLDVVDESPSAPSAAPSSMPD